MPCGNNNKSSSSINKYFSTLSTNNNNNERNESWLEGEKNAACQMGQLTFMLFGVFSFVAFFLYAILFRLWFYKKICFCCLSVEFLSVCEYAKI